jgi:hypothetical protein
VIEAMSRDSKIDIITSHYVTLTKDVTKVGHADRLGAIELLNGYNSYTSGAPDGHNTKRWGFSEDVPSGIAGWDPPYAPIPPSVFKVFDNDYTAAHVRVEAWEFLMNGGAVFDHLAYRWGNVANPTPTPSPSPPATYNSGGNMQANLAREQLGYLGNFLKTINLDKMTRTMPNDINSWLNLPPTYGQRSYWAAMSRPNELQHKQQFLFYFHRSTIATEDTKYEVWQAGGANPRLSLSVRKLAGGINTERGCFRADWYYPSGKRPNGNPAQTNGVLTKIQSDKIDFSSHGLNISLLGPAYVQDILVKITRVQDGQCPEVLPP